MSNTRMPPLTITNNNTSGDFYITVCISDVILIGDVCDDTFYWGFPITYDIPSEGSNVLISKKYQLNTISGRKLEGTPTGSSFRYRLLPGVYYIVSPNIEVYRDALSKFK